MYFRSKCCLFCKKDIPLQVHVRRWILFRLVFLYLSKIDDCHQSHCSVKGSSLHNGSNSQRNQNLQCLANSKFGPQVQHTSQVLIYRLIASIRRQNIRAVSYCILISPLFQIERNKTIFNTEVISWTIVIIGKIALIVLQCR